MRIQPRAEFPRQKRPGPGQLRRGALLVDAQHGGNLAVRVSLDAEEVEDRPVLPPLGRQPQPPQPLARADDVVVARVEPLG